jgi:hypothetical protein
VAFWPHPAEVTEAKPSSGGANRLTIFRIAGRMMEEADKESEGMMIGSVDSSLKGTEKAAAAAKAGEMGGGETAAAGGQSNSVHSRDLMISVTEQMALTRRLEGLISMDMLK